MQRATTPNPRQYDGYSSDHESDAGAPPMMHATPPPMRGFGMGLGTRSIARFASRVKSSIATTHANKTSGTHTTGSGTGLALAQPVLPNIRDAVGVALRELTVKFGACSAVLGEEYRDSKAQLCVDIEAWPHDFSEALWLRSLRRQGLVASLSTSATSNKQLVVKLKNLRWSTTKKVARTWTRLTREKWGFLLLMLLLLAAYGLFCIAIYRSKPSHLPWNLPGFANIIQVLPKYCGSCWNL